MQLTSLDQASEILLRWHALWVIRLDLCQIRKVVFGHDWTGLGGIGESVKA
jgi:hypothetical protein